MVLMIHTETLPQEMKSISFIDFFLRQENATQAYPVWTVSGTFGEMSIKTYFPALFGEHISPLKEKKNQYSTHRKWLELE